MPPLSRARRQTIQLIALALVLIVVVAAYLSARGGGQPEPTVRAPTRTSAPAATPPGGSTTGNRPATDPVSGLRWVDEAALPAQARETLALIRAGGPYPYPRNDDKTFGNLEGLLPAQRSGYYREYTVITPGSPDRGARRIVVGAGGETYYTDDHYRSFTRIREGR